MLNISSDFGFNVQQAIHSGVFVRPLARREMAGLSWDHCAEFHSVAFGAQFGRFGAEKPLVIAFFLFFLKFLPFPPIIALLAGHPALPRTQDATFFKGGHCGQEDRLEIAH